MTVSPLQQVLSHTARALIELRGEPAAAALAEQFVRRVEGLDDDEMTELLQTLLADFGHNHEALVDAVDAWRDDPTQTTAQAVGEATESARLVLFRQLNTAGDGIRCLLHLRAETLARRRSYPELAPVDHDLEHLLRSWFNRGFLELRRLDWSTPAHILETLIAYEAVHEIQGWDDLRRRLDTDRRSFGFFHPNLPDEPIIFVEVALTSGMSASIQHVLEPRDDHVDDGPEPEVDTAIFYSITNCQMGLRGISFGNFLIKQVTALLSTELPQLDTFATLSPIPGFSRWLADARPDIDTSNQTAMEDACAHYLCVERSRGRPLDPVARFHLHNGARVERLNWMGDTSAKGMGESHGMLVNYRYSGQDLEANHESLVDDGIVIAAPDIVDRIEAPEGTVATSPQVVD